MVEKKSVAKKAPAKKKVASATKKTESGAKSKKRDLVHVFGEMCFWVNNGPVLSNLADFERALGEISKDQFAYHVNRSRNDFASWVQYVLMDEACAKSLKSAKTQAAAKKAVAAALKKYNV